MKVAITIITVLVTATVGVAVIATLSYLKGAGSLRFLEQDERKILLKIRIRAHGTSRPGCQLVNLLPGAGFGLSQGHVIPELPVRQE